MSEEIDYSNSNTPKRPTFLKVLCILTFISTGFALLGVMGQFLSGPMSEAELEVYRLDIAKQITVLKEQGWDSFVLMMKQIVLLTEDVQANFKMAMSIAFLGSGLGLVGAIQMWMGKKIGFHMYIIYCLLSVGGSYLYADPSHIPTLSLILGLLFSGGFVFMYSRNLHWMK